MSKDTYYQRNKPVILQRAKGYYHYNKEILREKAKNKYRELSEEEKDVKRQYQRNRYHSVSDEKKKRELKDCQRSLKKEQHKNMAKSHRLR